MNSEWMMRLCLTLWGRGTLCHVLGATGSGGVATTIPLLVQRQLNIYLTDPMGEAAEVDSGMKGSGLHPAKR